MTPMCNTSTGVHVGWAVGTADCESEISIEYFNTSGVSQGASLPANWKPCVQGETGPTWEPTHETLTYGSSVNIDFATDEYKTVVLGGNIAFTGSNYSEAREIVVLVNNTGVTRTVSFDSNWVFVGSAAPTTLAAAKRSILRLVSFGALSTSVVATWEVQP